MQKKPDFFTLPPRLCFCDFFIYQKWSYNPHFKGYVGTRRITLPRDLVILDVLYITLNIFYSSPSSTTKLRFEWGKGKCSDIIPCWVISRFYVVY
jgi:hypothetical protein